MSATDGFDWNRPGTDLPSYARALRQTHEAMMDGGRAPSIAPRSVIVRSWGRSRGSGLRPQGDVQQDLLSAGEIERRRESSLLREVMDSLRRTVIPVAEASPYLFVVTDEEGTLLWREGSPQLRRVADSQGFVQGAQWSEERVGTNAIGVAIAEQVGVQVFSAEHYCVELHPWYCTAAPVHDPRTGKLAGVVDFSGPALSLHPAISALVNTAVQSAEAQMWSRHVTNLARLRAQAAPLIAAIDGQAVVIDAEGWIAEGCGATSARRVAVPRADRPVSVPGLGMCMPEPIPGGWLLRVAERQDRVRLVLDLRNAPTLSITGNAHAWRAALTARHAELVLLVHLAGRSGISAGAISQALYGDADHLITVRAEVSRLRRHLGGNLLSRPYRFSVDVELIIDWGDADLAGQVPVIAGSTAPAIRALARRPVGKVVPVEFRG